METLKAISSRQSIRKYLQIPIKNPDLNEILNTAVQAPCSGNIQTTRIIVITNEQKKEQIADACLQQTWMTQAPIHLVLCSDDEDLKKIYKNRAEFYAIQNAAVAAENILIAATSLNIGSCFISAFTESALQKILKLPKHIKPQVVITLGYANDKKPETKKEPLEHILFFEEYGKRSKDMTWFPLTKHKSKIKNLFIK